MVYANAMRGLMFCINLTCRYYGEDCSAHCPGLIDEDEVLECNGNGECDPSTLTCQCVNNSFDPETCNR